MDIPKVHANNAAWWDENADWYGERELDSDIEYFRSGGSFLLESELRILGDLGTWCHRAIHLQCSRGREALSLLRHGVEEVVGVDISERLIAVSRRKSETLGANASWICADILETPHELDDTADLVYTGQGALCWMMDMAAWAQVVARLLKPGGRFFILEGHPLDWVWDEDASTFMLDANHGDYFSTAMRDKLFAGVTQNKPLYKQWTIADIVNSLIEAGLEIKRLEEYPDRFWNQFPNIPEDDLGKLPHTFALLARKP